MIDYKQELQRLQHPGTGTDDTRAEVSAALERMSTLLAQFKKKQNSIEMQTEEIFSLLEEQSENGGTDGADTKIERLKAARDTLLQALIGAADLIEDYYIYAEAHGDASMREQAALMWHTQCKKMTAAGLIRIADEDTPVDPSLNHIEGITHRADLPEGWITGVIKSGYRYKERVIRRSSVVVNKQQHVTTDNQ